MPESMQHVQKMDNMRKENESIQRKKKKHTHTQTVLAMHRVVWPTIPRRQILSKYSL